MARSKVLLPAPLGTGNQHRLATGRSKAHSAQKRRAIGHINVELFERHAKTSTAKHDLPGCSHPLMDRLQTLLETAEPFGHRLPCGNVGVGIDDEGEGVLDKRKCIDRLHQAAQPDLLEKVTRRDHDDRKDHRHLRVAQGKPGQPLLALHDLAEIFKDAAKALLEKLELDRFASVEGDTLGVFSKAHQTEAEIGLKTLTSIIQGHQRSTDFDRQPGSDARVEQGRPDQIGRDMQGGPGAKGNIGRPGQSPQDNEKRNQGNHRADQAHREAQHIGGELVQILCDALVGVVGPAAQLQLIISLLRQPGAQVSARQPAPPADLEHLTEVKAIDRHRNGEKHQNAEIAKLTE